MKQRLLAIALLIITILAFHALSSAATDPIVCTMEITPSSLSEPGDVTVTITVSNSGDTDMTNPLTLFDPTSQVVNDFGDDGSVTLKAGEVKTWTGKWNVNERTLENGQIVYFVKYSLLDDKGVAKSQSQPIRGTITKNNFTSKVSVVRTITPGKARDGQTVSVIYDIVNEGNVSIKNLVLHENADILKDQQLTVAEELKAGETAQVKLPVVMGKKDLTSEGKLTYTIADGTEEQTFAVDPQVITYAEPSVIATLTSDVKGAQINGTVKLTLVVDNVGNVDYTDVRVTDKLLGDVFTNQTLPAGEKLTLEKEVTLTQTTEFQFEIFATDNTGDVVSFLSDPLSLVAVDPTQVLQLELTLSSDKMEVYTAGDLLRFSATIKNPSTVNAANVKLYQANTEIAAFASIPAGETRTFSRDVTLSMAGKYQLRAEAQDALESTLTFESNILQIAFLEATPAPVTADPNITATPEPTFVKATYPKISDPDIGTLPKLLRMFFYPLMIAAGGLFVIALILLAIASGKRAKLRKASENALDHLERSNHRNYVAPADEQEKAGTDQPSAETEAAKPEEAGFSVPAVTGEELLADEELPHMKYVRNAYQIAGKETKEETAPAAGSETRESSETQNDQAWNVDPDIDRKYEENPYRRRSGRVSPYARKSGDAEKPGASEKNSHTEDPS